MRSLAVLVLVGALLALLAGCDAGISEKDTLDKQKGIEKASADISGGQIPEDEKRD